MLIWRLICGCARGSSSGYLRGKNGEFLSTYSDRQAFVMSSQKEGLMTTKAHNGRFSVRAIQGVLDKPS